MVTTADEGCESSWKPFYQADIFFIVITITVFIISFLPALTK